MIRNTGLSFGNWSARFVVRTGQDCGREGGTRFELSLINEPTKSGQVSFN